MSLTNFFAQSHTANGLRKDVRRIVDETSAAAQEHMLDPAMEAARRAGDVAHHAYEDALEELERQAAKMEEAAAHQYNKATRCVTSHPAAAVGAAFVGGVLFAMIAGLTSHR